MEIKAKCTYDYKTCKAMAHAYTYKKQKPVKAMLLHIFFAFILGAADIYLIQSTDGDISVYIILGLCLLMVALEFVMYFLMPRLQYNSMSKMKDISNDYIFRDDYFFASAGSEEYKGALTVKYSLLEKVMETGEYFILFQNKRQAYLVEKSTLEGGTAEDIREKLQPVLRKKYIICKY